MKQIDFIIPYVMGPGNGMELKFALRSIEKNFLHDNYRIVIVGDRPNWLTGVEYLQFARIPEQKNRNFSDQLIKLYAALTGLDVTAQFIWSYDDVYFTRGIKLSDMKQLKAVAGFHKYPHHLDNSGAGSNWKNTLDYTMESVMEKGGSNYNYETHLPRFLNKNRVLKLYDKFNLLSKPMMISSLYYNFYFADKEPLCLFDTKEKIRFLLRSLFDVKTLNREMNRHLFTNNNPLTWNIVLKKVLGDMFPEKSKYEL